MSNKAWVLFFLFMKVSLEWVDFTIPFPKETFPMTYSGVKSQDVSMKQAIFLINDQVIIRNLQTSVQTSVPFTQASGSAEIRAYFEDDISTMFQIFFGDVLGILDRSDQSYMEFSTDVIGMAMEGQYGFYITTSSQLNRITYPSLDFQSVTTSETPVKIISTGNGFITVQGVTSTYLYNHDLELISTFGNQMATFLPSLQVAVQYDNTFGSNLILYDLNNNHLSQKTTNGYFQQIFQCSSMIVLVSSTNNAYYNFTSPTNVNLLTTTSNTGSVPKIGGKCYKNQFKFILVRTNSLNSHEFYVDIYTFGVEGTDKQVPLKKIPHLSPIQKQINYFNHAVLDILQNDKFQQVSYTSASVTGVLATNPLTRQGIKPIFNFFEDLWFYGFHPIIYPDFIEAFTTQVDVLNMLKIKPQFLNFQLSIDWIDYDNKRYISAKQEQINAPDTVFMLQSIKDTYIVNLPLSAMQFFLLLGIKQLCKKLRNSNKIFSCMFRFLKNQCLWFTLIISIFESCIVPMSFYGGIQFNFLFSFDFSSKLNCVFTILLVLVILLFSFTFFAFIKRYSKPETSRELLDFSKYFAQSFWLQTCTRCLRGLLQGLINGFFLNRHPTQLPLLIILDLVFVFIIFKFRKCFMYTLLYILSLLYFLLFFILDSFLLYYSIMSNSTSQEQLSDHVIFNFASFTIVVALLSVAFLKTLFFCIMTIYNIVKSLFEKDKIQKVQEQQEEGFQKKTEDFWKQKQIIKNLACETFVEQSFKNPYGNALTARISKKMLKIRNMDHIIQQATPQMPLKLKRNKKKAHSFDKDTFNRSKSLEFDQECNKQNIARPSKFGQKQ